VRNGTVTLASPRPLRGSLLAVRRIGAASVPLEAPDVA